MNTQNNVNVNSFANLTATFTNAEMVEFLQKEVANNPALNQFRHDFQESQSQNVFQAFGDTFSREEKKADKREEVTSFLGKVKDSILSFFEDAEEQDPFYAIKAYNDLIPQANINATLKEFEMLQHELAA